MTNETRNTQDDKIDLAEMYRPVALGAVRAALSVSSTRYAARPKADGTGRLLIPESLPE